MKILDSSVVILFLNDIDGKEYFTLLSCNKESLHIPTSVYDEILDDGQKTNLNALISESILAKMEANDPDDEVWLKKRFPGLGSGEINVLC